MSTLITEPKFPTMLIPYLSHTCVFLHAVVSMWFYNWNKYGTFRSLQQGHSVRGQSARGPPMPGRVNETVAMQDTGAQPQSPNLASILSALSRDDSKVDDVNAVEQSGLKRSILQQTIIVSILLRIYVTCTYIEYVNMCSPE